MAMALREKVAAAEILHDRGPANFGTRAGTNVVIIARGGERAFDIAGKKDIDMAGLFIFGEDFCAAFFEFAGHLGRITFDSEIHIAKSGAGDEIADRASGEIDVVAHGRGEFLNT